MKTIMSAATATGAGTGHLVTSNKTPYTCIVTWGGTAPTNTVVAIEGSIDGTTWGTLASVTVTASGTMFHIADKPVDFIRANYVSKSGGDTDTAVTVKCSNLDI